MKSGLSIHTKLETQKNQISVNPVNNINVNVRNRSVDPDDFEDVTVVPSGDVKYPDDSKIYTEDDIKGYEKTIEAFKIIISMMKNNPIMVNKLIMTDDIKLAELVKLLTDADEVSIDAEDLGEGCCSPKTYRKVNAIYVIKDGNTKNLKYDYPSITKELKELGISTKIVW